MRLGFFLRGLLRDPEQDAASIEWRFIFIVVIPEA